MPPILIPRKNHRSTKFGMQVGAHQNFYGKVSFELMMSLLSRPYF